MTENCSHGLLTFYFETLECFDVHIEVNLQLVQSDDYFAGKRTSQSYCKQIPFLQFAISETSTAFLTK